MPSADALVLRAVDFSESSLIVTLYTRQFGKTEALAKGGRRLKSPFESSLDILARDSIAFIQKRGESLDLLTESKLIRRFRVHSRNFSGTLGGFYVAELLNSLTAPNDPIPALYDLSIKVLHQLETGNLVMRTLIRYEGRLLQILGHSPSLRTCVQCGKTLASHSASNDKINFAQKYITFGMLDGGVLCSDCLPQSRQAGQNQTIAVKAETLAVWDALTNPIDRSEHWKEVPMNSQTQNEIRRLANQYICNLLGWQPRLHAWWRLIAQYDNVHITQSGHSDGAIISDLRPQVV